MKRKRKKKNVFVTAINCIDGRVQKCVIEFSVKRFKANYVDLITEPGPDKVLSEGKALDSIKSVKRRVLVSVEKHKSKIVVIAGHHDCAANPVGKKEHHEQIKKAVRNMKKWTPGTDVYGVWIDKKWRAFLL